MSTLEGVNYASSIAKPQSLIKMGEYSGEIKSFYEAITPSAALLNGDTIKLGPKFPKNAVIVGGFLKFAAQGGTCTVNIGNEVGAEAVEAADADSLASAVDISAAGLVLLSAENCAKFGEKFSEEVQLVAAVTANGANASAKIQLFIQYVIA